MPEHDREREVFEACLELSASERSSYILEACRGRSDLQERILSLLAAHEQPFMDEPLVVQLDPEPARPGAGGATVYCHKCQTTLPGQAENSCPKCAHKRPARGWPIDRLLGQAVAGGQYRVLRRLGAGGFGVVYEVETAVGSLRRALKVLKEDWADEESVRQRFIKEAVALERIDHPNVARCFAAGTLDQNGELYLLFELIDGSPLSDLLGSIAGQARLEPLRAVRIAKQVAAGLAAAHAKHILHRDLKPANVMILEPGTADERVKLLDFGIAKFLDVEATMTAGLIGTPAFMAPEQFSPESVIGPRVDLWQLGALLFWMLTGRPPYTPDEVSSRTLGGFYRKAGEPGPFPTEFEPSIATHPTLDQFVARLLATDPANRPASAAEVWQKLESIEQEEATD